MVNPRKRFTGAIRNVYQSIMSSLDSREDTDRMLSYFTRQQVKFLDRKLGITFYLIMLAIASYIVGYMFIYMKGYLELEQAKGAVVTHVYGDAFAVSSGKPAQRYFSTEELTYPGMENGNVFIATRQTVHKQQRGTCEDNQMSCAFDTDCSALGDGKCSENGYCFEKSWCDVEEKPEIYELDTGNLQIWTRSIIQFVKIAADRVYTTEAKNAVPRRGYNTFTVRELLMKCEPMPVRYEEIAELGAIIEVQFFWDCNVKDTKECHPKVTARRLDSIFDPDNIGFAFSYPEYIDGENRYRNEVRGVRIFFRTAGIGKKVSVAQTINKASLGAALFTIAQVIADLLMTKCFKLKNKYKARKFENTPDFSDYMKKVETRKSTTIKPAQIEEDEREVIRQEEHWLNNLDEAEE